MLTPCVRATNWSTIPWVHYAHSICPRHQLINNSASTLCSLHVSAPPTDQQLREYIMLTPCVRATNWSTIARVHYAHSMCPSHLLISNSEMTWRSLHRNWKLANLMKQNKRKENCTLHTFIFRIFIEYCYPEQIKVIQTKTCSTHGGHRKCTHTHTHTTAGTKPGRNRPLCRPRRRWCRWTLCQRSRVSGLNSTGSGYRPSCQTLWECNRTRFSMTRQRISWSTE